MRLRYSQIAQMTRCPKAYEFRYVRGVVTPQQSYLVLGRGIHHALACYFNHKILSGNDMPLPDLLDLFSSTWDKGGPEDENKDTPIIWDESKDYLKDVGILLLTAYRRTLAPSIVPLAVETEFIKTIAGVELVSHTDLIATRGIIDYKTAKRRRSQDEADRDIQPTIHMIVSGTPDANYEYHLLLKQKVPSVDIISTKRTPAQLSWFEHQLLPSVVRMIQSGLFPPLGISSWLCAPGVCEYHQLCQGRI